MKLLVFAPLILVLASCVPTAKVTTSGSTGPINPEAPFIWKHKTFPKDIQIASNFVEGEVLAIKEMAQSWDDSVDKKKNFFRFGSVTSTIYNLDKPDTVMGIYKVTHWPEDLSDSSNALAITQLFGRRHDRGTDYERVEIEHADILVNYNDRGSFSDFEFYYEGSKLSHEYDLRTVILHEMGHFLGLNHIPEYSQRPKSDNLLKLDEYKRTSVMYPAINQGEEKRTPQAKDINLIFEKYIDTPAVPQNRAAQNRNEDPGVNVKIIIELRKDGECLHKENGVLFKRHKAF